MIPAASATGATRLTVVAADVRAADQVDLAAAVGVLADGPVALAVPVEARLSAVDSADRKAQAVRTIAVRVLVDLVAPEAQADALIEVLALRRASVVALAAPEAREMTAADHRAETVRSAESAETASSGMTVRNLSCRWGAGKLVCSRTRARWT